MPFFGQGRYKASGEGLYIGAGEEYNINAYNSISSDINYRGRDFPSNNTTTIDYNSNGNSIYSYDTYLESTNETKNISWNTDYTKTFEDNEERELSVSYQLGNRNKTNISDNVLRLYFPRLLI